MGLVIPKQALNVYSLTGQAPDTPRWNMLESRMEKNPARFTFYHPTLAPLLTDSKCIGLLPEGKFYDGLRGRYALNPTRFTRNHPLLGMLLERDAKTRETCLTCKPTPGAPPGGVTSPEVLGPPSGPGGGSTTTPSGPPTPPVTPVPEPATIIPLGIGLIIVGAIAILKRKKAASLRLSPA